MDKQRILIVDDEKINITVLRGALQSDYQVQAAKKGSHALEIALESPPDLILLDIMMPEMDGYEVCKQLKSNDKTKNIPVIFLTAMSDFSYETKGLDLGAADYITKPIHPPIVKARVKLHLEREEYKNHLQELVDRRTNELMQAKNALQVANKAKGDFLMNMSHELRTPLNGVLTATDLISTCQTEVELQKIQNIINASGRALLDMIEQILDFIKSKTGELELGASPFRLDDTISKIKYNYFYKGANIYLKLHLDCEPLTLPNMLIGDQNRMLEVLNHLLENASKFTRNPPEVTLKITPIGITADTANLQFSITDNGIGIAEKNFEKIFDPFWQVDDSITRQYDGVGIGLSVCKQLVELMGGKIWLNSELDKGSTFFFSLCLKRQPEEEPFDMDLVQWRTEFTDRASETLIESLIDSDVETFAPLVNDLNKALSASDPQGINTSLSHLSLFDFPYKSILFKMIYDYEYDEAILILRKIVNKISTKVESPVLD